MRKRKGNGEMEVNIMIAMIAGAAGIAGAAVTVVATVVASKLRMKEAHQERIARRHSHLSRHAYKHLDDVYVPLAASLSKLQAAYGQYRRNHASDEAKDKFCLEIDEFVSRIEGLWNIGADLHLSDHVSDHVRSLTDFLLYSKRAESPVTGVHVPFLVGYQQEDWNWLDRETIVAVAGDIDDQERKLLSPFISASHSRKCFLAAPIESDIFSRNITIKIHLIRTLMVPVGLGAEDQK